MEKEEAINKLNDFKTIKILYGDTFAMHIEQLKKVQEAIETVLQALENSISKKKIEEIEEIKDKIEKAMNLANDCIEKRIIVADSDSLNFGRKQAHNYDIELIKELLENK